MPCISSEVLVKMSYQIFIASYITGILFDLVKSDDVALSNRLSRQLCNNYDNSKFGRVLPDYSQSLPVCPVVEKEGSTNEWVFNNCGGNNGGGDQRSEGNDDKGGHQRPGRVRGLNKPKGGSDGGGDDYDERIINGRDAPPFSHPYLVYIRVDGFKKGLSGVIYNRYTIIVNTYHLQKNLGAAKKMDHLRIHIGKHVHKDRENEEEIRFICNHTTHPKHQDGSPNMYFVYSAIHLYDPITISNYADKTRLAKQSQISSLGKNCLLPGWGDDKKAGTTMNTAPILQEVDATVRDCVGNPVIDDNEFCTNPVYCWADTGSPLMCTEKHRIFASGMASATGRKTSTECKSSKDTIYSEFKFKDVHDWLEKEYQNHQQMCRSYVRDELL